MGGEALFLLIAGVLISRKAPAAVMTKEVKL
jgi:hypothetical protein